MSRINSLPQTKFVYSGTGNFFLVNMHFLSKTTHTFIIINMLQNWAQSIVDLCLEACISFLIEWYNSNGLKYFVTLNWSLYLRSWDLVRGWHCLVRTVFWRWHCLKFEIWRKKHDPGRGKFQSQIEQFSLRS